MHTPLARRLLLCSVFLIFAILVFSFSGCHIEKEVRREEEKQRIVNFLKKKGDTLWEADGICYCPKTVGDTLHLEEGSELQILYTLYALTSKGAVMLSSNIAEDIEQAKLSTHNPNTQAPLPITLGTTPLLKGIDKGLRLFAHQHGNGWLGIPSEYGYGARSMGHVPRNSPLVCYIECVQANP